MSKKISDRSREFSQKALDNLNSILKEHQSCPDAFGMEESARVLLLHRMQQFGNAVAATNYKKFSFYKDAVKAVRNQAAHSVEDDLEKIDGIFKNFFGWAKNAKTELEENIGRSYSENRDVRNFEKFSTALGSEQNRKRFVDSTQSRFFGRPEEENQEIEFENQTNTEQQIVKAANSFFNPKDACQKELLDFAKSQTGLADSIQKESVEWVDSIQQKLVQENPFAEEEKFVRQLKKENSLRDPSSSFELPAFKNIAKNYSKLPSVKTFKPDVNLNFYETQFKKNEELLENKNKDGSTKKSSLAEYENQNNILSRNLVSDMEKTLEERKTKWELEQIENARREFLKELYEKIEKFKKLMEHLKAFTKDFGRLWNLAQGELNECGFDILEQYADLLQNDEGLTELAEMIGRHKAEEKAYHKELRSKIIVDTVYNPEPAYKGELSGLKLSDNIPSVLPSELALYSNPKTRNIFKMKFAQKQLLSYAYVHNYEYQKTHEESEEVEVSESKEEKGPMIICADTSGSMNGTPERVAKTIAFALAQKSLEEERGCYLISFSTGIETMELTSFNSAQGLENLVKFLRMSFHGGTDVNPALEHSVKMLEENPAWKNADVLVVSDFIMDGIDPALSQKMDLLKEKKTRFFSLAVTSGGNEKAISAFDKNWIYDTNSDDAGAKLVRQLYEINHSQKTVRP